MPWVGRAWWELHLAEGWKAADDSDCLTITRSMDGAFQLSAAVKEAGSVSLEEVAAQAATGSPPSARPAKFAGNVFMGLTANYMKDEIYWQKFWLAHESVLLFASYVGLPSAWRAERDDVLTMLKSLRPRTPYNKLTA